MSLRPQTCDVLIAGGGPAGLAAAIALRQRGADVLVADAQRPPLDKPCGEGLMPDALSALASLGVTLDARHGAPFSGIAFVSDDASVAADFPAGAGLGVRRTTLHPVLLERAAALGVRFSWGTPVALSPGHDATLADTPCRYRWLVGADGQASRVRAWAGLEEGSLRSRRFGFRAHFAVAPWSPRVEIHWGPLGQAYVTPLGPREVCVSVMTRRAGVRLADLVRSLPHLEEKLFGARPTTKERGSLTVTRRLRRVTRGKVALVGDASGSADAITGEGLAMSFRQAVLLADSLDAGGLTEYEARHAAILSLPQRMASLLLLLDRFAPLRRRALSVLAARPEIFRALLAVHVGEQPLRRMVLRHGAEFGARLVLPPA